MVTISELRSLLPHSKRPPAPVTITDPAVTKKIAALIDALPVSTLGVASCPAMFGGGIELTFRAKAGGPALAAVNSAGGCDTALFSVGGKQQPALAGSAAVVPQGAQGGRPALARHRVREFSPRGQVAIR